MRTLIFADVHLKVTPAHRDACAEFVAFLRRIDPAEYERVIVLGDLFDFWFEYRHVMFSGYFEVLRCLADLNDQGVELHLICGNHDFWAGRFLEEQVGMTIHRDEFRCDFGGRKALLVHGDGINSEDYRYRVYKRFARSWLAVNAFRLIHPDWAMAIAQAVSGGSRAVFGAEDPSEGEEKKSLERYAKTVLAAGEVSVVICAHSHYPQRETYPTPEGEGTYLNTGDWLDNRSYVEWDGAELHLRRDDGAG